MTLSAGTKLGPYEILAPIGAGGMGEVYRARDPRLTREVAIKVLPATFSQDPDRLKRFEAEARAAGVLNHPNITAVYDFGMHDGAPYIVTELLEGETLRSRLGPGAISPRKAIDYAVQIAKGLAAAHEKGIVHRDLKPENVFVTKDGRVKILDFGLAKLKLDGAESGQTDAGTVSGGTLPGVVLGTMGYMSPEQVRGKPADRRSDLFSFGTILYEMLSGQRAFRGDTAADTITAILSKEPPDISQTNKDVPPGLDRIVRHCLEKNPEERFESARDVAFDLESLSHVSTPTGVIALPAAPEARALDRPGADRRGRRSRRRARCRVRLRKEGRLRSSAPLPAAYLPARRGLLGTFRPGRPDRDLRGRLGRQARGALRDAHRSSGVACLRSGRGGSPRDLEDRRDGRLAGPTLRDGVRPQRHARRDRRQRRRRSARGPEGRALGRLGPDGREMAIVREVGLSSQLEYPIGKVLYQTAGWVSHPRVSPKGDLVAFMEHPQRGDDGGMVAVIDRAGKKRTLTERYTSEWGVAWSPKGDEIWLTAAKVGANRALYAVSLAGKERMLARVTQSLTLQDVSRTAGPSWPTTRSGSESWREAKARPARA